MLCFVLINSVLLNILCVWIKERASSFSTEQLLRFLTSLCLWFTDAPYGQLPYVIYNGKKYGQSVALASFFAREFGELSFLWFCCFCCLFVCLIQLIFEVTVL